MTMNILDLISGEDALCLLRNLCHADEAIRERILSEVKTVLNQVDRDAIADEVLFDLDALGVDDLWERSGPKQNGYSSPDEMAVEMVEETLRPYGDGITRFQAMDMQKQARQYCTGVLKGIYRYDQDSQSEFKEQAPDVATECFGWILDEWRGRCTQEHHMQEMKEFLSRECPKWAD
jgi:hypothetical protein